jgi:hypothetical protein
MQLDVHDTKRRIERASESIRRNQALPEDGKQKIFTVDEFLGAIMIFALLWHILIMEYYPVVLNMSCREIIRSPWERT